MKTFENTVREKYRKITRTLIDRGLTVTTMESCTAGLIASLLTDTEGASAVMKGAFVTYSNDAKIREGVPASLIERCGVYSRETADAMAARCREIWSADLGIGVTGTFGNADPANADSVPGRVFLAAAEKDRTLREEIAIPPQKTRYDYKLRAADAAADLILRILM